MNHVLLARRFPAALAALCILALGGCDVAKFTADSTAGLFTRAAPAFESYWDYELAGEAVPEAQVASLGCNIKWAPRNAPDYYV